MSSVRIVITNDDGIAAEGLQSLTRAIGRTGIPAAVVAPATNRSGVARFASYGNPVALERLSEDEDIVHYACDGTPVDCVRVALLGDVAPGAELVVSGINHGPNLGDDTLNSGTVGAACEGALLGAVGLSVSQQHHEDHFHILDSFDQATPVYDLTAEIAALFAVAMLEEPGPERTLINVNVPARIARPAVELTRLGRRFYERGSLRQVQRGGVHGYLTYGERDGPAPPFEDEPGTDFWALKQGRVSATPMTFAWGLADAEEMASEWAGLICKRVAARIKHQAAAPS